MTKPTIGTIEGGKGLQIDIKRLLLTRLLVQASSGGGKSWLLRRVLEQTANDVQQIILDIEGEFVTLREKFDYIICAPHGADAVATPQTAAILARRLRETRASAIIDMYELKMHDRRRFVRLFLEELIETPKSMWHPCLVVVDEAHLFCPEKDQSESMAAVIDLATRGRKRGLCALLATQRLAKLHKDTAAELKNKLIGSTVLDTDIARAAGDLGMTSKDATPILRKLDAGEFYCFGPALSNEVVKVKVGSVVTTHPEPGAGAVTKPPEPSSKIKAMLAKLTDLPKEAEEEARTLSELKAENARLKRDLYVAKKAQPRTPATEIKTIEKPVIGKRAADSLAKSCSAIRKLAKQTHETHKASCDALSMILKDVDKLTTQLDRIDNSNNLPVSVRHVHNQIPEMLIIPRPKEAALSGNTDVTGPEQRILDALAWFESLGITEPELAAVAFLAGYTVGGGGFNNPRGALRTKGLINYVAGNKLSLTDSGRALARAPAESLTNEALHQRVMSCLPGPEQKLLAVAIQEYPGDITDSELAHRTGYTAGGGGFNNPKGRLRTLGLVTYPQSRTVRAADLLFPNGKLT